MPSNSVRSRRVAAAAFATVAVLGSACSASKPAAVAADAPIEVTAVDYAFEGLPDRIDAGATVSLVNSSDVELHEFVAVRIPDDETRSAEELVALPQAELAAFFPFVTGVVIAPPGEDGIVVEGAATLDEPGRYLVICAIPTGADPAAYMEAAAQTEDGPPDVPGGPPHFVRGMFAEVEVVEG